MIKDYLFYESGECEDALRNRSFYLVTANSEKKAWRMLLEHHWFLYQMDGEQGHRWTAQEVNEQYSIFLSGKDIKVNDLGYDIRSLVILRP